jgi:hypothetical protein
MKARLSPLAVIALLCAGPVFAQVGGHPTDTKTINGTVQRVFDCEDSYSFFGTAGQTLWADVDGSRYRQQRNWAGFFFGGFCIEVVDPYGKPVCWSDGENTFHSEMVDMGFDPALACRLKTSGHHQVRVSIWDRNGDPVDAADPEVAEAPFGEGESGCGDLFYRSCDRFILEAPVSDAEGDEEEFPPLIYPRPYLLNVSLRSDAAEGFIQGAIFGSVNRF